MGNGERMWPKKTEPNVVYMTPTFPLHVYADADAIEIGGIRFERVGKCTMKRTFHGTPCSDWECSECGKTSNTVSPYERCPRCGARVQGAVDADKVKLSKNGRRLEDGF